MTHISDIRNPVLTLFVTNKCNLSCEYCFLSGSIVDRPNRSSQTIDVEFVKYFIDDFLKTNPHLHLRFFGAGEPTLELELIKKIYGYAKNRANTLITEIQTNGYFSKSTAEWLGNNIDLIWVSFDGPPDVHDRYRLTKNGRPTSSVVEKNITRLVNIPKAMTGIRTTISNANVARQNEFLLYYSSLGIKNIWADPVVLPSNDVRSEMAVDLMQFVAQFLDAQETANKMGIIYGSNLTCNFKEDVDFFCRACLPSPRLTTDGYISACDMAYNGKDPGIMSPFIYGSWDSLTKKVSMDKEKINKLKLLSLNKLEECYKCPARLRCGGYCYAIIVREGPTKNGDRSNACKAIRALYANINNFNTNYPNCHP